LAAAQAQLQEAQQALTASQHAATLKLQELDATKTQLSHTTAKVLQLERDARTTATLAVVHQQDETGSVAYYKHQNQQLHTRLQGMTASLQESQRQAAEYRRHLETSRRRSMQSSSTSGSSSSQGQSKKQRRFGSM
jgi:hypothetical protein